MIAVSPPEQIGLWGERSLLKFLRSRTESSYRSAFLLLVFLVLAISAYFVGDKALNENNGVLLALYGVVLSLAFATQVSEIYFTKPNDVVVNAITCLVVMLPQRSLLIDSPFYWVVIGFAVSGLVFALLSNLFFDAARGASPRGLSKLLLNLAQLFGSGRLLFGMCAFLLMLRVREHTWPFGAALIAVLALLLLTPSAFRSIVTHLRRADAVDGVVTQILGNDRVRTKFTVKVSPNDFFAVMLGGETRFAMACRIVQGASDADVDLHLLSGEDVTDELRSQSTKMRDGVARVIQRPANASQLLGVVTENTDVLAIAYRPIPDATQAMGDIVAATVRGREVYYQIQNAAISIEPTAGSDKGEFIQVKAAQLGVWDAERQIFDREGWVPNPNSAVRKPRTFPAANPQLGEVSLGNIPGTDFLVSMNVREAITHHIAVLGVTGVGKSVFVRELVKNIPIGSAKFICIDITGEYISKVSDAVSLVSVEKQEEIAKAISDLYDEKAKYPDKQKRPLIVGFENTIKGAFEERIRAFLASDDQVAVLEMADLDGTLQNYEYLKWFFRAAMAVAKSRPQPVEQLLCLVLEEAHTIVPEWNFLGDSDRSASSVVNSISQVALQGRKYGVGLLVIAQRTANVSKTVLTQCNTVICFQQFDRTSFEFLNSFMGGDAENILPNLKLRTAVAAGKAIRSTAPLVFRVPEIQEISRPGEMGRPDEAPPDAQGEPPFDEEPPFDDDWDRYEIWDDDVEPDNRPDFEEDER